MLHPQKERFLFNASGTAFAGTVHTPYVETIEGQAATCLSIDGGASTATSERFNFREIFSFSRAVTFVTGSYLEKEKVWETLVTSRVENLNILNVITADVVVARLASRQPRATEQNGILCGKESEHLPLGSYFENLRIAGYPVHTAPGKMCTKEFATFSKAAQGRNAKVLDESIFESVFTGAKGLPTTGNAITVPGFGRITLGELFVLEKERLLTMIRAELGCPVVGNVNVGFVKGNGVEFPPV